MTTYQRCLRVGITGGIGSGKTTVTQIFSALGIPVYDADSWAKWLIVHDKAVIAAIIGLFGTKAYLADGSYNRAYVADIVFKDPQQLAALNAAVHPAVEQHSRQWHMEQAQKGVPYTLKEAALLVESGSQQYLDFLIVVTAPEALRIQRVMQRDGFSESVVKERINHQMPEREKAAYADFLIVNDGQQLLLPQVWKIHHQLIAAATVDF